VRVRERVECRVSRDGARESLEKGGKWDRCVGMPDRAHWPERAAHETEEKDKRRRRFCASALRDSRRAHWREMRGGAAW
jgi:hypothetical protein